MMMRNTYNMVMEIQKERNHLGDPVVGGDG
jgi:hypothetical protein